MAKMFYSLEEAAAKLGMDEGQVRELAATGNLQQFRDRDKVMFKREQIDELAEESDSETDSLLEAAPDQPTDTTIPLADEAPDTANPQSHETTDSGTIDLITALELQPLDIPDLDDTPAQPADAITEPDSATGESASDPTADVGDPSGITQIADPAVDLDDTGLDPLDDEDEDLVLEQVGSGSGLLDLTRESDDTSLGTELLDEIYPASPRPPEPEAAAPDATGPLDTMEAIDAAITSSSIFDTVGELDISTSGLENLQDTGEPSAVAPASMAMPSGEAVEAVALDYPGNGLGIGMLLAATGSLLLTFIVMTYALMGVPSTTTQSVAAHLGGYSAGLAVLAIVLGLTGFFLGRVQKR